MELTGSRFPQRLHSVTRIAKPEKPLRPLLLQSVLSTLISTFLLSAFGGEVCPYIKGQGPLITLGIAAMAYSSVALLRWPLRRWLIDRAPLTLRSRRVFVLEFGLHLLAGNLMHGFNSLIWDYPIGSLMQLTLGTATLGFFLGLDQALREERAILNHMVATGIHLDFSSGWKSLVRKFSVPAFFAALIATVDLIAVVSIDLQSLANGTTESMGELEKTVATEIALICAAVFLLGANLIWGWIWTLRHFLAAEIRVLEEVRRGNLDCEAPVASRDELGQIAMHTNQMIEGLRERRQVKEALGKIVSPRVARELLEGGLSLGGDRREVVVLFSDIRGFTSLSDEKDPALVVSDLNAYFTRMVEIVHQHGGVVDKFIGDGMMAIFGLDSMEGTPESAIAAARSMLAALPDLQPGFSTPLSIGIGLHLGPVIAGNIGSPNRLEFTVIGDTVNTAARLETLCKEAGTSLLFTDAILERLPRGGPWIRKGEWKIRGKNASLQLWTVPEAEQGAG